MGLNKFRCHNIIMKSITEYKLENSLKEWSEGKISLGDVSKENNISIWQAMKEVKKRGFTSNISLDDLKNNFDL